MDNYIVNIFKRFKKEWALLTVKDEECINSMTIGWGELGTLWGKNVITIYIIPNQKTHTMLQAQGEFYVHFFSEQIGRAHV